MTALLKYKGQWRLFKGSNAIDQAKAFGCELLKQGIHSIIYNHGQWISINPPSIDPVINPFHS